MDLIEFLRARVDEDEAVARKAAPPPWSVGEVPTPSGVGKGKMIAIVSPEAKYGPIAMAIYWRYDAESAAHIARWDPARVLAEVEAKRRILDFCDPRQNFRTSTIERVVLRELVQPYADNPDFDPSWLVPA